MYGGGHDETGKSLDKIRPLCYGYSNIKKEKATTKGHYQSITQYTRRLVSRLPLGAKLLDVPTYLCAAIYIGTLCLLHAQRDSRLFRAALVPAAIALAVMWVYPSAWVILFVSLLCALISALRVLFGKHYPSDVLAALLLAGAISYFGYSI